MVDSTAPTVAVFGATGRQGGAVVEALLDRGARVRALVRDPTSDRARALTGRHVDIVHADYIDPASLVAALAQVDAFFFMTLPPGGILTGDTDGEIRMGKALADAAASAGVSRIVFSSVGGAERGTGIPHFESKRRVEEYLEKLALPCTVVRPTFFIDNLASRGASAGDGEIVIRLPLPDGIGLQMVTTRDIGIVAAEALLGTITIDGALEIAGDERNGSQLAAAFATHTGRPARYEALPLDVIDGNEDLTAMFRWFADAAPAFHADLDQLRAIVPGAWDVPAWLSATRWAPDSTQVRGPGRA